LLRDLNDDLYKHPYDQDLKQIGKAFADLVRPMIETVDRYGLRIFGEFSGWVGAEREEAFRVKTSGRS
jgi:hypothetical protein